MTVSPRMTTRASTFAFIRALTRTCARSSTRTSTRTNCWVSGPGYSGGAQGARLERFRQVAIAFPLGTHVGGRKKRKANAPCVVCCCPVLLRCYFYGWYTLAPLLTTTQCPGQIWQRRVWRVAYQFQGRCSLRRTLHFVATHGRQNKAKVIAVCKHGMFTYDYLPFS